MKNAQLTKIINHFKQNDPKIYVVAKHVNYNEWFGDKIDEKYYFTHLCSNIIGQQLSGKAARAIKERFSNLFSNNIATPQQILKISDQELRDLGLSWAKVKYVKDLAEKVANREVKLNNLAKLSDDEVIAELTKVKGIGKWTAEMFFHMVI